MWSSNVKWQQNEHGIVPRSHKRTNKFYRYRINGNDGVSRRTKPCILLLIVHSVIDINVYVIIIPFVLAHRTHTHITHPIRSAICCFAGILCTTAVWQFWYRNVVAVSFSKAPNTARRWSTNQWAVVLCKCVNYSVCDESYGFTIHDEKHKLITRWTSGVYCYHIS